MAKSPRTAATPIKPSQPVENGPLCLVALSANMCVTHSLPSHARISIGRSSRNDVCIDDESVSRQHALLHRGPSSFVLEDLESVNGTRIGGEPVDSGGSVPIAIGEAFQLGSVTVILRHRRPTVNSKRVWSHEYFESRLEDEVARAKEFRKSFGLVHIKCEERPATDAFEVVAPQLRAIDVVGAYGPAELAVMLIECEPDVAQAMVLGIATALEAADLSVQLGLAIYPRDARDSHGLTHYARGADEQSSESVSDVLTGSDRMRALDEVVGRVAPSDISVLILGETGVGKEVMAEDLHRRSKRGDGPFLRLSCVSLADSVLESELFGYTRGAFTGALSDKIGLLESANGGTVFLDEFGELPLSTQAKLLRVLEERRVTPVGAVTARPIDVRFVAATNRDLERDIETGRFRADLYYRINGFSISIPPLRERVEEIEPLAHAFVRAMCERSSRPVVGLSGDAMRALTEYSWPGNVRELRNVMERAVILCDGSRIGVQHLPIEKMASTYTTVSDPDVSAPPTLSEEHKTQLERIRDALAQCAGNQTHAAKMLGVSRRTMVNWMNKYGLPRPRKRGRNS